MGILIVEDTRDAGIILQTTLQEAGFADVHHVESAARAFEFLGVGAGKNPHPEIELVLMDILMPQIDGIKACFRIKQEPFLKDIPVIMVTATDGEQNLQKAFDAGAMDYIGKPFRTVELLARVRSALHLKGEIDRRKERELELSIANQELERLAVMDALTGVANRRMFDNRFDSEWRRAIRGKWPLSLVMVDVDFFKRFNDKAGHLAGDACLRKVAQACASAARRPADLMARYGGEEFVAILPETNLGGAMYIGEAMRRGVEGLHLPHPNSEVSPVVTISVGVASILPTQDQLDRKEGLLLAADCGLLEAKKEGRNRMVAWG